MILDPLSPSRAAFYSAILQGWVWAYLGQYWKIPLVYAAIGASAYYYKLNNDELMKYRNAYKRRLAGYYDDEYTDIIPNKDTLLEGMRFHERYKDMAFIYCGHHMLNILEANVSVYLLQFNVSDKLSFKPHLNTTSLRAKPSGVQINIIF